jgi:hypothetical protein
MEYGVHGEGPDGGLALPDVLEGDAHRRKRQEEEQQRRYASAHWKCDNHMI